MRDRIPKVELRIRWLMPYLLVAVVRIMFMMCVVNVVATAPPPILILGHNVREAYFHVPLYS